VRLAVPDLGLDPDPGLVQELPDPALLVPAVPVTDLEHPAVPVQHPAVPVQPPAVPVLPPAVRADPEEDLVDRAAPAEATRGTGSRSGVRASYLICATPRTGSYFLCDLLTETGVAGRPTEYLLPGYRRQRSEEWGTRDYVEYHEHILAADTTPNGVFGTKVHGAQMLLFLRLASGKPWLHYEDRHAVVEQWFPDPTYVWLRRRDRVAQSVSWVRARQSHIWWDSDVDPAPPIGTPDPGSVRFDFEAIDRSIDSLSRWDAEWRTFFDAAGIEPVTVWYEDLIGDSRGCVDRVLGAVGVSANDAKQRSDTEKVNGLAGFRKQGDETSVAWENRFRRLDAAKLESNLSALTGIHSGEAVYLCAGNEVSERIPRDAITISVDGAWSPAPASFALLTTKPETVPAADVVVTTGHFALDCAFVIRARTGSGEDSNVLRVAHDAGPIEIARAFASHLGASQTVMVGS
jgi:LPS sulfotransferase NodH